MTPAQTDAFLQIKHLMREHFQAGVLIVEGDASSDSETQIETVYHGGYAASIGLMELGKLHVWRHGRDTSDECNHP